MKHETSENKSRVDIAQLLQSVYAAGYQDRAHGKDYAPLESASLKQAATAIETLVNAPSIQNFNSDGVKK